MCLNSPKDKILLLRKFKETSLAITPRTPLTRFLLLMKTGLVFHFEGPKPILHSKMVDQLKTLHLMSTVAVQRTGCTLEYIFSSKNADFREYFVR